MATSKKIQVPASIPVAHQFGLSVPVRKPKGSSMQVVEGVCLERPPVPKPARTLDTFAEMMHSRKLGETVRAPDGRVDDTSLPRHVLTAKQMLTFSAFFKEAVVESTLETFRVRNVLFRYFLEDDTAEVREVSPANSGIDGGPFVKRHALPKAGGGVLHWSDFQIGSDIFLYGRAFRVVACDAFTRKFCEDAGAPLAPDSTPPEDKYTTARHVATLRETGAADGFYGKQAHAQKRYMEAMLGNASAVQIRGGKDTKKQFLEHDREVLHFKGVWDDRSTIYGSKLRFRVNYFLADDTVEVLEIHENNSGRERFPALLKRQRLPKSVALVADDRARGIEDGDGGEDYFSHEDFRVGMVLPVLGRDILLYDADKFTFDWVLANRGIDMHADVVDVAEPAPVPPAIVPPPPTGYGTEEDSLGSVFHLRPKPPKKNIAKMRKFDGVTIRYSATIKDAGPVDSTRKFIIAFYPATDEMQVYEPPQRNTGVIGGLFMARERTRNPDTGNFFALEDFAEGSEVVVRGLRLVLGEPDKRSADFLASMA